MASPRRPYFTPDEHEPVQERAAREYAKRMKRLTEKQAPPVRACRHCGVPLSSGAEYRLGIHVWCVYAVNRQVAAVSIPGPSYGKRQG
jgi:hypothetical protein